MSQGERKLAAIMFTDIEGYTALAQSNESRALAMLSRHNALIRPLLPRYGGREVKTMGDAFLIEFGSALDASECAVEMQKILGEYNESTSEKVLVRIGIHVGDVVHSGDDIYGDAVNIASRIEPQAQGGQVCVSQQVYDQVKNKVSYAFDRLETRQLKNVKDSIDVYRIVMPLEGRKVTTAEFDVRRIAVLPFANFSPNPDDSFFADGLTEEIISAVSNIGGLSVISRTSVMGYKGTAKRVKEIGKELEVGSILEGSVRKAGNRIRIATQLIEVKDDRHIWAQNYDRDLGDIFAVQSDIAKRVADSLSVKINSREEELIEKEPTKDLEAYELYLNGRYQFNRRTKESIHKAIEYFQGAVRRDPDFALAYSGMALCHVTLPGYDPQPPRETYRKAKEFAMKALELDDTLAEAHISMGSAKVAGWDWEGVEREFERAIELNPNYAEAHYWYAMYLTWFTSRFEKAVEEMHRAAQLSPLSPIIRVNLAAAYNHASKWDEAIVQCKKALDLEPNFVPAIPILTAAYRGKHLYKEAIEEDTRALSLTPGDIWLKADLGWTYGMAGMREQTRKILGEVLELSKARFVPPGVFIALYFSIGEMDKMYDWMQTAYDQHESVVPQMRWDPDFREIRSDPRFVEFMKQVGLE